MESLVSNYAAGERSGNTSDNYNIANRLYDFSQNYFHVSNCSR
jgi:hypothetical protein